MDIQINVYGVDTVRFTFEPNRTDPKNVLLGANRTE